MSEQNPTGRPYSPALTGDSGQRIAHALEYIAARLGEINAKLAPAPEKKD